MSGELKRSCVRSYVDHQLIVDLKGQLDEEDFTEVAEFHAMLANETRLKILYCLTNAAELCVCDLADILQMDVSAISHQLRKLKDRGLVKNRRDGLTIYYYLVKEKVWNNKILFLKKLGESNE